MNIKTSDKYNISQSNISQIDIRGISIIGLGEFSHGTSECWNAKYDMINYLLGQGKTINIYLEDVNLKTAILNDYIKNLHEYDNNILFEEYDGWYKYPLRQFITYRHYSSLDFYNFIKKLKNINNDTTSQTHNKITIYGIDMLVDDNIDSYDQIVDFWGDYMKKQPIHNPDIYNKYRDRLIKQQLEKIDRNKAMFDNIKFLHDITANDDDMIGIVLAHNFHIGSKNDNKYKEAGYHLQKYYGSKYLSLAMSSIEGTIRYEGEWKGNDLILYKEPKTYKFTDCGTFYNFLNKTYDAKKMYSLIKTKYLPQNLMFFTPGWNKTKSYDIRKYDIIDNYDYIWVMGPTTATMNILSITDIS